MHNVRKVTDDLYWIGGDDHRLHLFENIHPIPRGVSYNSYLLMDKKTVLFDTVDWAIGRQFLENLEYVLNGKKLDYMVINHMEPDHAAMIEEILLRYPDVRIISNEKAFYLMNQFGYHIHPEKCETVVEGDTKSFGKHKVVFVAAPMVHWPEAMVTFDTTNGVLFSADAFGSFGALDGRLFNDEVNFDRDWLDDARRYYTNIVGKYGPHVQSLLKKAPVDQIKFICPLHGPVWRNDFAYLLDKYNKWSKYIPEEKGVMIVYASMYGNTENAASILARKLVEKGMTNVHMYDVSKFDVSYLISDTFRYSHIVFASVTYNLGIYPKMHNYLMDMKALNLQKRTVMIMENGSWACKSGELMTKCLEDMKDMNILNEKVTLTSSVTEGTEFEMDTMVDAILDSMK
ncbi:FprA family A-type flavoprotein [Fusobacterium hominis]|uniref:FprA family A-type flavoprotein n=1 Tax=Fusobacterium hominis TaxID=2764326 RepID=UPI0022E05321|nr:FprA family A-type flavoprotein [Fusobacterium hominis]